MHDLYKGDEENTYIKTADSLLIIQCTEMHYCYPEQVFSNTKERSNFLHFKG